MLVLDSLVLYNKCDVPKKTDGNGLTQTHVRQETSDAYSLATANMVHVCDKVHPVSSM